MNTKDLHEAPNAEASQPLHCSYTETSLSLVPRLRRAISNILVSQQDTDDLIQEAFVRGMRAWQSREIHSLDDYLFIVTRNLALKEREKQSDQLSTIVDELSLDEVTSNTPCPEHQMMSRARFNAFIAAVNQLPKQCQRAFLLRHMHGFSQKEIAREMGIAESTVEKHLAKGLKRCAAELEALDYLPYRPVKQPA